MHGLVRALHVVVPVLWTAAAAAYFGTFLRDDSFAARWGWRLAFLAAVVHLGEFAATTAAGLEPLVQPGALIAGMGLSAAMVYMVLERQIGRRTIGIFAVGTAALLVTVGAAIGDPLHPPPANLPPGKTSLHVAGGIMGYSGLLLAAIFGSLLLAQRNAMRKHAFGLFWERLPSIELLDSFAKGSLVAAAIFLTATIGLGHAVRWATPDTEGYWDAKVIATNLLWLLTLVTVVARRLRGLRPPSTAVASIVLFGLALLNLLVVNRFSRIHSVFN
jgi:ABC-type uncharacterized transport system permease subunit